MIVWGVLCVTTEAASIIIVHKNLCSTYINNNSNVNYNEQLIQFQFQLP